MTKFTPPPMEEKKEYKIIPAGTHVARCISFIDLGTQEFEWQGEIKTPRKVRLSFETPNETAVFDEEKGEQPFLVSIELTLSYHEKANLTKFLCSWFGVSKDEVRKLDPERDMIGKECLLNISHETSSKGNEFAKIQSISPLMKGTECPKQVNDSTYFFMGYSGLPSEFDDDVFAKLPSFICEKIMNSPEYAEAKKDPTEKGVMKKDKIPTDKEILDILS